ncbi:hypothetical protein SASPL_102072 [Salvia splendens]|uniref:Uncharacterized protein n=1 Tax=Salvia splendens TaxID=180675 RepID=A0A8X8YVN8_SALSN|nr:hypothetical protein SASPL_102072 [Salvia splendens]
MWNRNEDADDSSKRMQEMMEADERSYGVVVKASASSSSSPTRLIITGGRRAWNIGHLWLCITVTTKFKTAQLEKIAFGLDAAGLDFVWAVSDCKEVEILMVGALDALWMKLDS